MIQYFKKNKKFTELAEVFEGLFENSHEGIVVVDNQKNVLLTNNAFTKITLLSLDNCMNEKIFRLHNNEIIDLAKMIDIFEKRKENFSKLLIKAKAIGKNQETPVAITLKTISLNQQKTEEILLISFYDASLEVIVNESVHRDQMTNLPNRLEAYRQIGELITKHPNVDYQFGVILIDIDDIVKIKAMVGSIQCDDFIIKIVNILRALSQEMNAALFQISYSNFMIIVGEMSLKDEIESIHQRIKTDIQNNIKNEFYHLGLTFSMGVSNYPASGRSVDVLVDNAYKALAQAKYRGRGKVAIDSSLVNSDTHQDEVQMLQDMKQGLENQEFELHYQPLIEVETGRIEGAEVLARWKHPQHGLIAPNAFIPLAKKSGFIIGLGKYVIAQAFKQQKLWQDYFPNMPIVLAINISLREIEIGGFAEYVQSQLLKFDINPSTIRFEIPEDIAMANTELAKKNFLALKRLGVSLALDNFGLGQSSLVHLKELPLDALKVDLSFISDLAYNKNNQRLVKAMITLGKNFDIKVIVSGVEDQSIHSIVKHYGCDIVQGYYFSKPVPVFEFQEMLRPNEAS